jgi:ribosomal-protein-alanine N-acetyltransferase
MTVTEQPWVLTAPGRTNVRLVLLSYPLLNALGEGNAARASGLSPAELSPYLLGAECRGLWSYRSEQIAAQPADLIWVTRLIVDAGSSVAVGVAGFHGRPDEKGMVELGYRVEPVHRRRGYARAALEILLKTAGEDSRVSIVRATVSPDNAPSRALIDQYGFVEVGEQWDDEDGLEIIFEVAASAYAN